MRARALLIALSVALALTACGRQEPSGLAPAKAPAPATAPAVNTTASAVPGKTAPDAGKPLTTTNINEDGVETIVETPGDTSAQNKLLAAVASTVAAATPSAAAAAVSGTQWQDGVNYNRIVPAQPTNVPAGQVEVLEFFWYACPHCYALEPSVQAWLKSKPAYVTFVRVPVEWNEGHRSLARLFYALQAMGKLNDVHNEIFKEIQVNGNPLVGPDPNNAATAERLQLSFIKKLGLSEADFEKAYHGDMNVETALQRADELAQRYRVTSVPMFVVNGKYTTDVTMAGGPEKLMSMLNDLTAQEHKH
ncbi:MAG TPA: thiol:disulfide interchange protein DsbA/DsbL [Steroidobacteraceae bacterium]|jgi:thiol:disulfide interchange protein DsbA|nr:thiol:disulfide interchange protein DsbA/DsbL [Steroidobacteraceae bacterium]